MHVANSFRELFEKAKQNEDYWVEGAILGFTANVVRAMEECDISRTELASRLGATQGFVTKLLSGNANMTLRTMVRIARALDAELHVHVAPVDRKVRWIEVATSMKRSTPNIGFNDVCVRTARNAEGVAENDKPPIAA